MVLGQTRTGQFDTPNAIAKFVVMALVFFIFDTPKLCISDEVLKYLETSAITTNYHRTAEGSVRGVCNVGCYFHCLRFFFLLDFECFGVALRDMIR
jgi:hypothetical protein